MKRRALLAEAVGSFLLFATVVGSMLMAQRLSGGNAALALLANALATGAMLCVLIAMLGPVSGAHFNPVVSWVFHLRGEIAVSMALAYMLVQLAGGVAGVAIAHLMFDLPPLTLSHHARTGMGQWLSEAIATFGLVLTILATLRSRPSRVPASAALYIVAAYWFTASTSFANPAITIARSLTGSMAGIAPGDAPAFIIAQFAGGWLGYRMERALFGQSEQAVTGI